MNDLQLHREIVEAANYGFKQQYQNSSYFVI